MVPNASVPLKKPEELLLKTPLKMTRKSGYFLNLP